MIKMFEKVNPSHPDKIADRIAGALVDLAYAKEENPRIAVEVLIGHGECNIISETSVHFNEKEVKDIVDRISECSVKLNYKEVPQDPELADNQKDGFRCGDNGIFKGMPITQEQKQLKKIAEEIYKEYPTDGKYIINMGNLTICQSNAVYEELLDMYPYAHINPLGFWTGGSSVDVGATNRKLGSDMGDSITGGGLHGKDLSKADVSLNIYAFCKAQSTGRPVEMCCSIGDEYVDDIPYSQIVEAARLYIRSIGGFEKFAEWGLI